jgi:endo-1,4-beta-D-glucanase Y
MTNKRDMDAWAEFDTKTGKVIRHSDNVTDVGYGWFSCQIVEPKSIIERIWQWVINATRKR